MIKRNLKFALLPLFFLLFGLADMDAQRGDVRDALDDKSKVSGLTFGSYVSFGFFDGWQLELQPGVGYKITDWMIAGAGVNYTFGSQFTNNFNRDKVTFTAVGPRVYGQFNVFNQIYLMGEYQRLYATYKDKPENGPTTVLFKGQEDVVLLGGGYSTSFGEGLGVYTDFMFNVLWQRSVPGDESFSQPYMVRFGVFYTL